MDLPFSPCLAHTGRIASKKEAESAKHKAYRIEKTTV